jgi:uncharacterized protein (TIGR00730 family)
MNICFFCAASDVDAHYTEPARALARMVVEEGHTLVWGGSDRGLMREIASAAQDVGGKIIGISMESLKHTAREGADEMIITADLAERKKVMMERSDVIITLVGGTGTLDEMTEMFELKRHGIHNMPLIILNTDGFYDGLKLQYERMKADGFLDRLPRPFDDLMAFAETPEEAMRMLGATPTQPFTNGAPLPISNEAI